VITLKNTIVSNNSSLAGNCGGDPISDGGGNLRWPNTDASCVGDFGDPMLGELTDNGGPTQTLALLPGSAAIDSGNDTICAASPINNLDQRGYMRPVGDHCDIGAFEFGAVPQIFEDVNQKHWAVDWIHQLYDAGITNGCSANPPLYCPEQDVSRAEMAVFLERGLNGSEYIPPNGVGTIFNDVSFEHWAVDWIEKLYKDEITTGCASNPLRYCPDTSLTRSEMAIFLLRSKHGSDYQPPSVDGSTGFDDVLPTYWAAAWIKQLAAEGITSGCGGGNYCPDKNVTRAEMAKFLVLAFGLP